MNKKIFITYGNGKYQKARDFAGKMAKRFGHFDMVKLMGPEDIDKDFHERYKDTFAFKRGAGLWIWKPYIIDKMLREECSEGDYLFYSDAGAFFIRSVDYIIKPMMNRAEDIFLTATPLVEWQFTKADCFKMLDCDNDRVRNSAQIQSGFICIRKSEKSVRFIKDWLALCCDLRLLHPQNIYLHEQNPPNFVANRDDQTLLSLLAKKRHIVPHRDPTQFGKYPERYWLDNFVKVSVNYRDKYPVCIILHRSTNLSLLEIGKSLVLTFLPRKVGLFLRLLISKMPKNIKHKISTTHP